MPLRLKSLELHGFKTFASRTQFNFADGVTAIVGPNGSGKSNFADSLRWVLGEQSHNLLRAKKTEDMIFSGSEQRPRSGMAAVTITFDNSDGWLPIDFSEVAVTRRAFRDGRNEYLLNGQTVRLRDVNELLAQSGLSERTYTILGQGMVDASLALKADERRKLFEEAAGIGLYRTRREESLRRLENTLRNLDRVLDILAELEPRLRGLEKQSKKAQEYAILQNELKVILREWYGYHWHRSQKELIEAQTNARTHEQKLTSTRDTFTHLSEGFTKARGHLASLRAQLNEWHRESANLHNLRGAASRELAVLDERSRSVLDSRERAVADQQRLADEKQAAHERLVEATRELEQVLQEAEEAKTQAISIKAALDAKLIEKANIEQKINTARQNLNGLNGRRANFQAHLNELKTRINNQKERLRSSDMVIATAETAKDTAERKYSEARKRYLALELESSEKEHRLSELRRVLDEHETRKRQLQDQKNQLMGEQARLQARLEVIHQAENSMAGFASGAKYLLEAARSNKLKGARGLLSSAIEVEAEYETAVAAALGDAFDLVLINSKDDIGETLQLLESSNDRAVVFPVDSAPKAGSASSRIEAIGTLASLITVEDSLRPTIEALLGGIVLVKDREAAKQARISNPFVACVTLAGEVFRADGVIAAGKVNRASALARPREKRELTEKLEQSTVQINRLADELSELAQKTLELRAEADKVSAESSGTQKRLRETRSEEQQTQVAYESAKRQYDFQVNQKDILKKEIVTSEADQTETGLLLEEIEEKLTVSHELLRQLNGQLAENSPDELSQQSSFWSARVSVSQRSVQTAEDRKRERDAVVRKVDQQISDLQNRATDMESSMAHIQAQKEVLLNSEHGYYDQIEDLRKRIEPTEEALAVAEQQELSLQSQEVEAQRNLAAVERVYSQLQIDLNRKQENLESLKRRIEEDFGLVQFEYQDTITGEVPLPMGDLVETLPLVTELSPDLEDFLNQKRGQIRRMGSVNQEAQQEYFAVKERFEFMTEQVEDLKKAESDLREVIAELDDVTRKEFTKTFEKVADEFRQIFTRLFGGGSAKLILTDPDNLTETGIDIEAKLPGRREQGLSLLSGGERSLTAISLVFALLKVSPTPLCVMDEVDAMLDEANVGRFRDLLGDLSRTTQFIVVTHNRNTVQVADVIYGITMGRDSASQQISLRLDELSDEMLGNR